MSLSYKTDLYQVPKDAVRTHTGYGFVLALVCMGLAILVASAIFDPVTIGSGISNEIWFAGP